ncbi:MAG: hypothetical protein LUG51_00755 [Tannerellaceae bacterium]|nr:hypothetical protein [Tannerellaceae bacterium]
MEKRFLCTVFSLLLLLFTSCDEKEDKNNDILTDTKWRLTETVNKNTNQTTTPQREGDAYYTLSFGSKDHFTGVSAAREFSGTFQVFSNQSAISLTVHNQTGGDTTYGDDQSYVDRLKEMNRFTYTTSSLVMESDHYTLKFKRIYPENN